MTTLAPQDEAEQSFEHSMLKEATSSFGSGSRELLEERSLLRRAVSKFLLPTVDLHRVLGGMDESYVMVRLGHDGIAEYRSLYFDTPLLRCFHDHRRDRRPRQKIRIRRYPNRQRAYLEVKTKKHPMIGLKKRLEIPYGAGSPDRKSVGEFRAETSKGSPCAASLLPHSQVRHAPCALPMHGLSRSADPIGALAPKEQSFLATHVRFPFQTLVPEVEIRFWRLTLLGTKTHERITLDVNWSANTDKSTTGFGDIAILEVKQQAYSARTPIMIALRKSGRRPVSFSKYCMALALTGDLRCNRFLPVLRKLERMAT